MKTKTCDQGGMSLTEVLVGVAIMTLVFMAFFSSFQAAFTFSEQNRLRSNALLLANEHLEMIRALPYDSVGTVSGLPSGPIPQTEDIVYQGKTYTRRTFIQYVDDPADGTGAGDTLTADYKRVKVELSYDYKGVSQSFPVITNIAPPSQESLTGAGVLRINVTDANNAPLLLSQVHIVNTTVATSVDITTFTNANGTISFPGAWAGSGYEVYVSKAGYSGAQTYTSTTTNPNPSPSPLNVAENSTTEIYFKIDLLSTLELYARMRPVRSRFLDTFDDASNLASETNTQVVSGSMTLAGSAGTYAPLGTSSSITITPASLGRWLLLSFDDQTPAQTSVVHSIEYDTGGGVFALIPDVDLPGNSAGFTVSPIDLGVLDVDVYSSLRVISTLTTTNPNVTPEVREYKVSYEQPDVPAGTVPFTLVGSKIIGADAGGNPIYKYNRSLTTGGDGRWSSATMEWDSYALSVPGYTVAEACPQLPIVLEPNVTFPQTLTLGPVSANSLQVSVTNTTGNPIERAEVHVVGGSTDETRATGSCGGTYFSGLTATTYTVDIEAPGYVGVSVAVPVSGSSVHAEQLISL